MSVTKRLKMTLADGEWRPVKELLKRRFPYLPPSTAAKLILLELSETIEAGGAAVTRGASESLAVPDSHPESPAVPTPYPDLTQALTTQDPATPDHPDPDQRREDPDQRREERGDARGESKQPRLAPLAISVEILSDLSSYTGKPYRPKLNEKARELMAHRMAQGATVEDFREVHKKKAAEWLGTEYSRFLRPSTLYGTKFGEYLAQPEAGAAAPKPLNPDGTVDVFELCGFTK